MWKIVFRGGGYRKRFNFWDNEYLPLLVYYYSVPSSTQRVKDPLHSVPSGEWPSAWVCRWGIRVDSPRLIYMWLISNRWSPSISLLVQSPLWSVATACNLIFWLKYTVGGEAIINADGALLSVPVPFSLQYMNDRIIAASNPSIRCNFFIYFLSLYGM